MLTLCNLKNFIRLFTMLAVFCGTLWSQTTVQVSPSTKNAPTGSSFSLDIIVNNVTNLHAASVTVKFNKTLVQYTGITQGGYLGSNGDNVVFFPTPSPGPADDSVKVDQAILGQGNVTGSGTLFTLSFSALHQIGTSAISLVNVDLRDQNNTFISSNNINGQVTVVEAVFSKNPSSISFGDVVVGSNKRDSVTISNNGNSMLHISSIVSDNSQFTVSPGADSISASSSKKYYITFAPTSIGTKSGNVIFTHDATGSPDTVTVSGRGTTPNFNIAPTSLTFSNVIVGQNKLDSLTISNSGTATLHVTSITSTSSQFSVSPASDSIAVSGSQKVYITFAPTTSGSKTGKIILIHDALSGSPDTVVVTGTGVQPLFSVNPTSKDFGTLIVGTNKLDSVTVTNTGSSTLNITSVNSDLGDFSILPVSGTIAPSSSLIFRITFAPSTGGAKHGHIIFLHDAPSSPDSVAVTGIAVYTGSISGKKFNDTNGNGVLNGGEPGIAGWKIALGGAAVETTQTDGSGMYTFTALVPGSYTITEVPQAGWTQTTSAPSPVVLGVNQNVTAINFGNFQLVSISGTKYNDLNGNGVKDSGEPGLQGWTIFLDANNNGSLDGGESNQTTDINGNYTFSNIGPGTYKVREVQQGGWFQTTSNPADVIPVSGTNVNSVNFGNFQTTTISGTKFNDINGNGVKDAGEPGLQGWTIYLDANHNDVLDNGETNQVTDANGNYAFTGLTPGSYRVREVIQIGWLRTTANPADIPLTSGTNVPNVNFGNFQKISINGTKFNDLNGNGIKDSGEPGLQGWTIYLDPNQNDTLDIGEINQLTDVNGNYAFSNLGPGTYRVREVQQSGWMETSANPADITVQSGANTSGVNFGNFQMVSISGTKFNDLNGNGSNDAGEPGLQGWTIFLDANNNGTLDGGETNTTTDINGNYTFSNIAPGTYKVREVDQSGWMRTTTNPADIIPTSGTNVGTVNFGNFQKITISGTKFNDLNGNGSKDAGEPGLQGWTIYLDANNNGTFDLGEPSQVTDVSGNYTFSDLGPGTYRAREVQQGGWMKTTPNPVDTAVQSGTNVSGMNFGNFQLVSISGTKINDLNGNGTKDPGEPGLQGWVLFLDTNHNDTLDVGETSATTDVNGAYTFTGLTPGTYRVREVLQTGWIQTSSNPADSTISSGINISHVDFCNYKIARISGMKFNDLNGDSVKSAGEPGLPGWTIHATMGATTKTTVTGGDGSYAFTFNNSEVGTWVISEVQQSSWQQTYPHTGTYSIVVQSGTDTANVTFGNSQIASISGHVLNDIAEDSSTTGDPGLTNWIVKVYLNNVLVARQVTAANGNYSFVNLSPGTYVVQESLQTGWIQTVPQIVNAVPPVADPNAGPRANSVVVISGTGVTGVDFANYSLGSIHGIMFEDVDGDSLNIETGDHLLSNWSVQLVKNSVQVATTQTDSAGSYGFTGLEAGTYTVVGEVKTGWYRTRPSTVNYTLQITSGTNLTTKNFGNFKFGTISGVEFFDRDSNAVRDPLREEGLVNETIVLSGTHAAPETLQTDVNGDFQFDSVSAGQYTLKTVPATGWNQTLPPRGNPYAIQIRSSLDTSGFSFGVFSVTDNFKFRTFTVKDYNMVSVSKSRGGYCKKPSAGNVRDSVFVRRGFGLDFPSDSGYLRIGIKRPDSSNVYGWLFNRWKKYRPSNVRSYIFDLRSLFIVKPHNKAPYAKRPANYLFAFGENVTEQKFSKYGNNLTVQLIDLKTNIAASDLKITPHGFGDLVYYSTGGVDSMFNNMTLRQIAAFTDTVLTNGKFIPAPHDTLFRYPRTTLYLLDTILTHVNSEFTALKIDTISTKPLVVKGAKAIFKVPYLRRDTTRILPLANFESVASNGDHPLEYRLEQNYPNPFNPTTTIEFELPTESKVTLRIFNILGQEVATLLDNTDLDEGLQSVDFDATDFATGVYFYRLEASTKTESGRVQNFTEVKKMLLVK